VSSLFACAVSALCAAEPAEKVVRTRRIAAKWRTGELSLGGDPNTAPPDRPARPDRPILKPPRDMTRRRAGASRAGRIALLHAVAHIELNAIDLAWDLVARFAPAMPRAFADDWVDVAEEEAKHFSLLAARLGDFGARYGDLPAHDGLWEAASATAHDLLARLAIVPLVLEARGLDVTPAMIERLRRFGDEESAAVLSTILDDEVGHVAAGVRWFRYLCAQQGHEPASLYRTLVRENFRGTLKPPFNDGARRRAGLEPAFYNELATSETRGPDDPHHPQRNPD
jgi:uncharacterized ferritin-like protein (DUF455 family)